MGKKSVMAYIAVTPVFWPNGSSESDFIGFLSQLQFGSGVPTLQKCVHPREAEFYLFYSRRGRSKGSLPEDSPESLTSLGGELQIFTYVIFMSVVVGHLVTGGGEMSSEVAFA